jgi:hypothetical protein
MKTYRKKPNFCVQLVDRTNYDAYSMEHVWKVTHTDKSLYPPLNIHNELMN